MALFWTIVGACNASARNTQLSTPMPMRSRDRHTTYKGLAIIVRWIEMERRDGDSWGPGTHRFTGSYLVAAQGAAFGKWQHLERYVFDNYRAAAAHALAEAQRAIDTSHELDAGEGVSDRPDGRRVDHRHADRGAHPQE